MPASQLHLLIIGAVSWQLERSRGLAEVQWHLEKHCVGSLFTQRAASRGDYPCIRPPLLAHCDWFRSAAPWM